MNNNTFWCSTSLKYSAIVSPVSATRIRAPGGSFICPNTRAVFSRTPDSFISVHKSLPSLDLSPTPVNIEYPPCSVATLLISSWINTVLPTPAPPNKPILPPLAYGAKRSITLIPVSNISWAGFCWSKLGASLWISHLSASSNALPPSIASPKTLNKRPNVSFPTGVFIPLPVATTSMSLESPSLDASITQRTTSFPICCATSITHFLSPFCTSSASLIAGSSPFSNATSTTGPKTCTILPVFIWTVPPLLLIFLWLGSSDYLGNFLSNCCLSCAVVKHA